MSRSFEISARHMLDRLGRRVASRSTSDVSTWALRIATVAVCAYGFLSGSNRVQQALILAVFYAAMATSYVPVIGFTRVLSFAHAALVGLGAYTFALVNTKTSANIPLSILAAVGMTALGSLVIAALTLRFRGFQLGVLTLALATTLDAAIKHFNTFTGGGTGLFGFDSIISLSDDSDRHYLVALGTYAAVAGCVLLLACSRVGIESLAVGDDEFLAPAVLVHPFWVRARALALGGALAGICGAMYAQTLFVINPETFGTGLLLDLLIIVYLAGDRTIFGLLAAALLAKGVPLAAGFTSDWLQVGFGLALATVLILRPEGLYPRTVAETARRAVRRIVPLPGRTGPAMARVMWLRASGVTKNFGGVRAADDVSFDVSAGHVVGIIGPNGSGKTTLLNCVSGFVTPTVGRVTLGIEGASEHELIGTSSYGRADLGIGRSFQTPRVFVGLTVRDNLLVAGSPSAGLAPTSVEEVATRWSLPALDRLGGKLTHVQRRWLELARLEYMGCAVLLLDEPAAGLGDEDRQALAAHLRRLRDAGASVVFVEHDLQLVASVADTIVVMSEGRAVGIGDWQSLARDPVVADIVGDRLGQFVADVEPEQAVR